MTKYIVYSFYFPYGVSKFDSNCNFFTSVQDILHKYIPIPLDAHLYLLIPLE